MSRIFSVGQLRASWGPAWADASDEEVLRAYAQTTGTDMVQVANALGYGNLEAGKWGNRWSGSIDSYQAGLQGTGEAVAGALGFNRLAESLRRAREDNETAAMIARDRAREAGAVMSVRDIGGVGDAADWVGGLAIDSAPYAAEFFAGGLAGRGLALGSRAAASAARDMGMTAAEQAAQRTVRRAMTAGGVAASYPSAVGDILQNQREQAGRTDLLSAGVGGVPYAALNVLGLEGALLRNGMFRNTVGALDNLQGVRGGLARATATGGGVALQEGASELGQEFINQSFGRMAVDPNETFFNPASNERFVESFAGGAALGFLGGAAGGGWRRGRGTNIEQPNTDLLQGDAAPQEPPALGWNGIRGDGMRHGEGTIAVDSSGTAYLPEALVPYDSSVAHNYPFGQRAAPYVYENPIDFSPTQVPAPQPQPQPRAASFQMPAFMPGGQAELFSYDQLPPNLAPEPAEEPPQQTPPAVDPRQRDMFFERPSATVRTDFSTPQILRELQQANGPKKDPYVQKIAQKLSRVIEDQKALEKFIEDEQEALINSTASIATTDRRQRVLDAAIGIADRYRNRLVDAYAQEGALRARPGKTIGQAPSVAPSAQIMRERNQVEQAREQQVASADALEAKERRARLERILNDNLTRNPLTRFTAELRKAGLDPTVTPEERAYILRHQDLKAALKAPGVQGELNLGQEPAGSQLPAPAPEPEVSRPGRGQPKKQLDLFAAKPARPASAERAQAARAKPEGQTKAAEPAPTDDLAKYDGVAVSLKVEAGGKTHVLKIADAGKHLRQLDAKIARYEQLLACLTR